MSASRREFSVPFGVSEVVFSVPRGMRVSVLKSNSLPTLPNVSEAVRKALQNPTASPRLSELARSAGNAVIVVTDNTRACPDHLLVPPILSELNEGGIPDENIRIIIGIGMHRPLSRLEAQDKLGRDICERIQVINPQPDDPSSLADLGITESGIPITVNRLVAEADLVVSTGIVEPHQYAGYSGGFKTVAIGAGGEPTIRATHSPQMLDHPGTRLAKVDGNPFQEAITEAGRRAGLRFILNLVQDEDQNLLAVGAGEPFGVFTEMVKAASRVFTAEIPHQFDVVVAGVGYPKDVNLYQASRAASYMVFAPVPVVREGGAVIIPAPCPEGVGAGSGEAAFYRLMRSASSPRHILNEARQFGYPPGGQRAFVMAKVLEWCTVYVAGCRNPEAAAECKMIPVPTVEDALHDCLLRLGKDIEVLVVPHSLQTLPVVKGSS
ncbi:MAG: nickel-dependent lactate racemase [Armatimonadota bacterium]